MEHPSSSIPRGGWGLCQHLGKEELRVCIAAKCSGQRILGVRGSSKDGDPGFLLSHVLPVLCQTGSPHWNLPQNSSNPLWKKSEQFPAPEYDAITEKKKKGLCSLPVSSEQSSLSSSAPLDRGNVSFANSSGVQVPHVNSQAQEVSHKP